MNARPKPVKPAARPLSVGLARWREANGLSMRAAGRLLDLSHDAISDLEHGRADVSEWHLRQLARAGKRPVVAVVRELLELAEGAR